MSEKIKLLPHQTASEEELLYARLDGKHTAMDKNEQKALNFFYSYTTNLAPNKIIAKTFQAEFAKQKLGLDDKQGEK